MSQLGCYTLLLAATELLFDFQAATVSQLGCYTLLLSCYLSSKLLQCPY
jgi:hypothetical protein